MYLKKLELSGFKSFADKSLMKFSPGINVVVGPNGCGKSNVLDSIRWGLGEQKSSVLRSKNMDEVIFAGTKKREPAGMAQVSFTLDNSDGRFPIDEPEVTICRRIFRDGAGQYLVNKKNVRLKDIQEAIADTGIGQGALFVLSSQEIIQVLSPNSNDRRTILEETAGINKYQIRKKETLRKLTSTRENIARLNDILQEVGRQVDFSRKQLNKLNRYKRYKEKLSRLECYVVQQDLEKLEGDENRLQGKMNLIEEGLASLDREIESADFAIHTSEKSRKTVLSQIEKERDQFSGLSGEEAQIRTTIDVTVDRINQAEKSIKEYETNFESLNSRMKEIESRIGKNQQKIEDLKEKIKDLKEKFNEKNQAFLKDEEEFSRIKSQVDSKTKEISSLREAIKISQLGLEHKETELETLKKNKKENEAKALKLMEELENSDEKFKEWNGRLEELEKERAGILQKLKEIGEKEQEFSKKTSDKERLRRNLQERLFAIKSEMSVLLREEEDFRGFSEGFRKLMQNRRSLPQLTPIHTIINVEEEYEQAIDIVLGAHFQSIITENRRDANTCIEFLKRERAGRLTFFPLDMNRSGKHLSPVDRRYRGVIDWARDLIECDDLYREIIDGICGSSLVVEDLKSAYNLYDRWKREGKFIPKMVTLDGDVLDFSGAVTGGKYRVDRSKLLSRQRKRRELEEEGKQKADGLSRCQEALTKLKGNQERYRIDKKELSKKSIELENEIRNISGQLKLIERLQKNAQDDLDRIEESESSFRERLNEKIQEIDVLKKEVEISTSSLEKAKSETTGYEAEYENRLKVIKSLKAQLDNIKSEIAQSQNLEGVLISKIENDTNYLAQAKADMDETTGKIKDKRIVVKELQAKLQQTKNKRSVLGLKIKALKIAMESSRKESVKFDGELEENREKLVNLQEKKKELEKHFNDLRIQKIECDSRRKYLEDRLKEFTKETKKNAQRLKRDRDDIQAEIDRTRRSLSSFDTVNFSAEEEFNEHTERFNELKSQIDDLQESSTRLRKIIKDMDSVSLKALDETLKKVNDKFVELFQKIFGGGEAGVAFSDPENKLESGIDITVKPPGKRASNINLLSSGEKSLTAITFLFALLSIKPGPFVILDELDAPLDESNVEKIAKLITEFSDKSQFIVITHNRKTMEFSDVMFGVTMEEPGVSKLVSVKMN